MLRMVRRHIYTTVPCLQHDVKQALRIFIPFQISLYEKMEKADVLDLTVKYLKSAVTKQQLGDTTGLASYQAGFRECQEHMTRVLITDPMINANEKSQMISHIASSRPVMTLNLPRPIHSFAGSNPPIYPQFTTTPPPSPIPSPTERPAMSHVEGLAQLSQRAELKPNRRLSYNETTPRPETVWRPW